MVVPSLPLVKYLTNSNETSNSILSFSKNMAKKNTLDGRI